MASTAAASRRSHQKAPAAGADLNFQFDSRAPHKLTINLNAPVTLSLSLSLWASPGELVRGGESLALDCSPADLRSAQ